MCVDKNKVVILVYLGTFIKYHIVPEWFCSGNCSPNYETSIYTDKCLYIFVFGRI